MMEFIPVAIMLVVCYIYGHLCRRAGYDQGHRDGWLAGRLHERARQEREKRTFKTAGRN